MRTGEFDDSLGYGFTLPDTRNIIFVPTIITDQTQRRYLNQRAITVFKPIANGEVLNTYSLGFTEGSVFNSVIKSIKADALVNPDCDVEEAMDALYNGTFESTKYVSYLKSVLSAE